MRNAVVEKQAGSLLFGLTEEEAAFFSVPMPAQPMHKQAVEKIYTEKIRKTYVIPTEIVTAIDVFCKEHKMKKTNVVTLALEEFLAKHR